MPGGKMKLRNKVLIAIGLAWILFLGFTYIGSRFFLLKSFLALEHTRADEDLSRVDQALDQVDYALSTFTSDWSHWNDLYSYMQGKNPSFIPNNLNMTAYVNSHINFMSYWDKQDKLLVGVSVDTNTQKYIPFPTGLETYLQPESALLQVDNKKKALRGFMLTGNGIMLVAADTATDGDKVLPPLGVMVNARYLDKDLIKQISKETKVALELFLPEQIAKSTPLLNDIFHRLDHEKNGHDSLPINNSFLNGFTLIRDIDNKPIGMFRMTTPRSIFLSGVRAIDYYLGMFLILGILFSILMIYLLRHLIVRRLEKLDSEVAHISEKNAIRERVDASGKDELASVASEVNHMLDIIQASHEQLENRVAERTEELQKTNIQLQEEITERKSVQRELVVHKEHLVRLAHYDNLTTLPNRVFFNEILNKAINHAKRHQKILAILFIDLDRFKTINDALGHPIGDLVLKEMGKRFSTVLRAGDIIARLGGDEYIILLNDINNAKYAGTVAEKILEVCTHSVKIETHEFYINGSIGISIYPNDGQSLEDLQRNADMAMYKAKRSGGGMYKFYAPEMDVAAHEHIKLEAELRKAIQRNEFVLYYQPQLKLNDGTVQRVEALIRWEHPELGLVSPAKFIPLAEETGLIMAIGEWAVHEACRVAKSWQIQGYEPITIAVNISPKQFRHQDVAQIVSDSLKENDLAAKYIEIEITETAVMDNVAEAIAKLTKIHSMGIHISVDDFGTGYTSISYLGQFPVSILKIDQTFIKGIPQSPSDLAITSAMIALGHNLGLEVVAEGVETPEQLQFLIDHHCDFIQGYYFSRPLPANKIIEQFTKSTKNSEKIKV
jgi:diguanylate cyclase (GGDEF)-like protein